MGIGKTGSGKLGENGVKWAVDSVRDAHLWPSALGDDGCESWLAHAPSITASNHSSLVGSSHL